MSYASDFLSSDGCLGLKDKMKCHILRGEYGIFSVHNGS